MLPPAPPPPRRLVAWALAAAVSLYGVPVARATGSGSLSGIVVEDPGRTPLAGATVHLADPRTGEIRSSAPTDDAGRFALEGVAPDRYRLGVEADGGVYVVPGSVRIDDGSAGALVLSVARDGGVPAPRPSLAPSASVWERPGIATLIVLGIAGAAALVVDQVFGDDEEKKASPSAPPD